MNRRSRSTDTALGDSGTARTGDSFVGGVVVTTRGGGTARGGGGGTTRRGGGGTTRTSRSVLSGVSLDGGAPSEVDELDLLRRKKERLTAELWNVMGEMQMAVARKAGHSPTKIPLRNGNLETAAGPVALQRESSHAYFRNRFGTTAQQSYNTESLNAPPQLLKVNRKYRRRVTDMTRYGEARAKAHGNIVDR